MFVERTHRWISALARAVAVVVGSGALAMFAVTPTQAGGSSDLVVVAGTDLTEHLSGPVLSHLFYVNLTGSGSVAAGKAVAVVTFPRGVQPNGRMQVNGPVPWDCTTYPPSVLVCKNRFDLQPNQGATRFAIELTVPAPTTGSVVSSVDLGNFVMESNENNNQVTTVYHFVP
ncbi:MAG: hypothetical protein U0893_22250 [Chloroflexota bacterium]